MCESKGREMIVRHLLALVQWALEGAPGEEEDVEMED
jgi:hypothetical protein